MSNRQGVWSLIAQYQAIADQDWTMAPGAPTGVSATAGSGQATVTFTAPTFAGVPGTITGFKVTASSGETATGSSSPITVTGLTNGNAVTFTVQAQNAIGFGKASDASSSVTPVVQGQQAYTSEGTYSWTAPTGVTSVSVVCIGRGGSATAGGGGGGGELRYKNNISVTPGQSYTVYVGAGSYFNNTSTCQAYQGNSATAGSSPGTGGSGGVGDGGGNGGDGGSAASTYGSGGGAGGYAGNGGDGRNSNSGTAYLPDSNSGAGAGGRNDSSYFRGGGGGGVGLLGLGTTASSAGGAGSGGSNGNPGGAGGNYGGGAGSYSGGGYSGGAGAVRIIWPGNTRQFPSTNTGDV